MDAPVAGFRRVLLDAHELRQAFAQFPIGVVGVCAQIEGSPVGLAVSTFVPVSLDPPLVSICIRHESTTWRRLRHAPRLGISVLSEGQESIARALAGPEHARFDGVDVGLREQGALFLADSPLSLSATVIDDIVAGDHLIIVARVDEVRVHDQLTPLIFHHSTLRPLEHR